MSQTIIISRTNHFAVKDPEKFREWADSIDAKVVTSTTPEGKTLYGLVDDGEGFLKLREADDDRQEDEEIDIGGELAQHLQAGWVAEIREISFDSDYIGAWGCVVNSLGERREIYLADLSEMGRDLGDHCGS